MSRHCYECSEEGKVFYVKPGSIYVCPECEETRRAEKKRKEELKDG
jgi:uncharacterized protein YlaI